MFRGPRAGRSHRQSLCALARTSSVGRQVRASFSLPRKKAGLSPHELAAQAGVTRATITGLLDGLEHGGLIARRPAAVDRRKLVISLTTAGEALTLDLFNEHSCWIASLFKNFDGPSRNTLNGLLQRARLNVDADTVATSIGIWDNSQPRSCRPSAEGDRPRPYGGGPLWSSTRSAVPLGRLAPRPPMRSSVGMALLSWGRHLVRLRSWRGLPACSLDNHHPDDCLNFCCETALHRSVAGGGRRGPSPGHRDCVRRLQRPHAEAPILFRSASYQCGIVAIHTTPTIASET